jgi:hypothetical protein
MTGENSGAAGAIGTADVYASNLILKGFVRISRKCDAGKNLTMNGSSFA